MKNGKEILAVMALVLAIGFAYASTKLETVESFSKRSRTTNVCSNVTTFVDCLLSGPNVCQDAAFIYYSNTNCVTPLYRP